jgi:hypothetical protein
MMSDTLSHWIGRWWVCVASGVISTIMFGYLVPNAVSLVTENRTLVPQILDEYYLTWAASDARPFFKSLGAAGRAAYQNYYLTLDFWFPVLSLTVFYIALLSLSFSANRRWASLNLLPLAMYACDMFENINHYSLAGSFPDLPAWQLQVGPLLSLIKYMLTTALPVLALIGFWLKRKPVPNSETSS